jgi:hypothetical protein
VCHAARLAFFSAARLQSKAVAANERAGIDPRFIGSVAEDAGE